MAPLSSAYDRIIVPDIFPSLRATLPNRGGYNSEVIVEIALSATQQFVVKSIGAKRGGFPFAEAVEITEDIEKYQAEFEAIGIPIPPINDIHLRYDIKKKRAVIFISAPWGGHDVEHLFSLLNGIRDFEECEWLIKEMCGILAHVCKDRREDGMLKVGIDAKASNFAVGYNQVGARVMCYVDQFPPRYWKQGNPIIEWTPLTTVLGNELGRFKYFDWRGVLLTMTSQLARIKPELKEMIEATVLNEFRHWIDPSEFNEFEEQFSKLPWIEIRYYLQEDDMKHVEAIIKECVCMRVFDVRYSLYTLREIALEFAQHRMISPSELENIFHHTHFEDEEFFPKKWKGVQDELCRFVRRHDSFLI